MIYWKREIKVSSLKSELLIYFCCGRWLLLLRLQNIVGKSKIFGKLCPVILWRYLECLFWNHNILLEKYIQENNLWLVFYFVVPLNDQKIRPYLLVELFQSWRFPVGLPLFDSVLNWRGDLEKFPLPVPRALLCFRLLNNIRINIVVVVQIIIPRGIRD